LVPKLGVLTSIVSGDVDWFPAIDAKESSLPLDARHWVVALASFGGAPPFEPETCSEMLKPAELVPPVQVVLLVSAVASVTVKGFKNTVHAPAPVVEIVNWMELLLLPPAVEVPHPVHVLLAVVGGLLEKSTPLGSVKVSRKVPVAVVVAVKVGCALIVSAPLAADTA
jgi:hypothetical protein